MNRTEHLLVCLMEECAEVAQRVSKALRFGLDEIQIGQFKTNAERIGLEMADLISVYFMLERGGVLPELFSDEMLYLHSVKEKKVEQYLKLSQERGTL